MRTQFVQREVVLRFRVKVDILSTKLDIGHIVDGDTGPVTARQMDCLLIVQLLDNVGHNLSNSIPSIKIVNVRMRGLKGLTS